MAKLNTAIRGAQIADAVAGNGLKWTTDDIMGLDLNELTGAAINVAADSLAFVDADDSSTKLESIADLATAMAGTGLTATDGVFSVDTIVDNLVENDIKLENKSAECDGGTVLFTLTNTPVVNSVQVFLRGLLQEEGSGKDYVLSGTSVTFAIAPLSGDMLIIYYILND